MAGPTEPLQAVPPQADRLQAEPSQGAAAGVQQEAAAAELPPSYPERARRSCREVQALGASLPAWMDPAGVASFAKQLDVAEVRALGSSLALDANATGVSADFASGDQEAGLICLMHALDFGGGWRQELHAYHGKGAWLTVKPGVEQLFKSEPDLRSSWLARLSVSDVKACFGLDKPGAEPLEDFAASLAQVCNEVGQELEKRGFGSVGAFVAATLDDCRGHRPAAHLVQALVDTFPFTFDDRHVLCGHSIYLYKKAQLVVGELYHRFRGQDPRFAFEDGDALTAFIDNVICAVLRRYGAVAASESLACAIEGHQPLPSGSEEEVSLRAAAMAAVEETVRVLRSEGHEMTSTELGNYLWGHLGKTPENRRFTRHATKDTVFY